MPTYEYQCEKCGHVFDRHLKIAEMNHPEKEPCESCGVTSVKRKILSGVSFNADCVRMDAKYKERVREWRKTIPHNTLPDV